MNSDGSCSPGLLWDLVLEGYTEIVRRLVQSGADVRPVHQFVARDFKLFIRLVGATHVRTRPYYPQSNGKIERWHGSLKRECIRRACQATVEEARRRVAAFVKHDNHVRLHSAIGYITPADKLAGLEQVIFNERDRKLEEARQRRQQAREALREVAG